MNKYRSSSRARTTRKKKTRKEIKEDSPRRDKSIISDRNHINKLLLEKNEEINENTIIITKMDKSCQKFNKKKVVKMKKEEEYKTKILQLEKEIKKEKDLSKVKIEENNNFILNLKQKILNCNKEIKLYSNKNMKQTNKLHSISKEIDHKLELISLKNIYKQISKIKKLKENENKTEKEIVDNNIQSKQNQLKNIITLIDILEKENEVLRNKIKKVKNTKKYFELIEKKKNQENKINELTKEIRIKKVMVNEHSKCENIKSEIMKKIESIRDEIKIYHEHYTEIKKKLDNLENKKKEKEKEKEKDKKYSRPRILSNINKNIKYRNNPLNLKLNNKSESLKNFDIKKIINKGDKKEIRKTGTIKNNNVDNNNILNDILNNNNLENLIKPYGKNNKRKSSFIRMMEEEMISIPPNLNDIFTTKELKAMLIGVNKNKSEFNNLLRKFNIQNSYADSLSTKHKLDIKKKINRINELDEQIEFLSLKKGETEVDAKLYKSQINEVAEIKRIYSMKVNKLNAQVEEKKEVLERKNEEIKILRNQLLKLKKLFKKGDMKSIKNELEIEVQYLDEEEKNNISKHSMEEEDKNNEIINQEEGETPKTDGTGYEEDNQNNVKDIKVDNQSINFKFYENNEENIFSDNNSDTSLKSS